jgi:hypothetical protein
MRDALRPQRCEDREVPVGGFAKDGIKPLSGFDDVLNRAILVVRSPMEARRPELRLPLGTPLGGP